MRMDEVRVGMRMREYGTDRLLTVTTITDRGFTYDLDEGYSMIPRWGLSVAANGHEHFGFNGECLHRPVRPETRPEPTDHKEKS